MQKNLEILVTKVELSDDLERLYFYTKNDEDFTCLWAQLKGQLTDDTEGRQPIQYALVSKNDSSESLIMELVFKNDPSELILLLKYLEFELKKFAFLSEGTTENIQEQISRHNTTHTNHASFK